MPEAHSPTIRGRKLGAELRRLREAAGLTHAQAANHLGKGWSQSKVSRIEGAKTKPTERGIIELLELYGVDSATREALLQLAKNAWRRGWWTDFTDVFRGTYVALENEASKIHEWSPLLVPGLLQIPEYAREVVRAYMHGEPDDAVQRRIQARMARQALLVRTEPPAPELTAIIDEAALRRPIGSEEIMREQMHALLAAGRRPNVTIRVTPYAAGAHAGLDGPFIILSFPEDVAPDVGYVETRIGDGYAESAGGVQRLRLDFEAVETAALSAGDSAEFIAALI